MNNKICLCSAFSGVASQQLPNGTTIHRRFKFLPNMDPSVNCNINANSSTANLLRNAAVIILDEVTMMNKYDLERIDRTLRDLMSDSGSKQSEIPFGGKLIILSGDFRQILP